MRETLPVAASIAPFALVIGATTRAGVPAVADMAAAATVFAGAAHLAVLTLLLTAGAGTLAATGTAVLISTRACCCTPRRSSPGSRGSRAGSGGSGPPC